MTLAEAGLGRRVRVTGNGIGGGLGRHLAALGINVGDEVMVVRAAPFRGPLLVEVAGSGVRVALGRGMAEAVEVTPSNG